MALKTNRVEAGHYRYEHHELGMFDIKKDSGYRTPLWRATGPNGFCSGFYRTKKACTNVVASHIGEVTGTKPERRSSSSNRTFEASHYTSKTIRKHLPYSSNGCVPIAFARALTRQDNPTDDEIGIMAALVSEDLATVDYKGTHSGNLSDSARAVGIEHTKVVAETDDDWHRGYGRRSKYRVAKYPTVAQFLRNNPTIKTAIFRTTGHAGYYDDGVAYGLGARARIDHALVLEWK